MRSFTTVAALLAFAAVASARPNGSPSCVVDAESVNRITNGMGANQGRIACTFTSDKASYTLGGQLTISYQCADIDNFQGIMIYAAPVSDLTKRVGEFTLLDGMKSNEAICGAASERPNSVITQSAPGTFPATGSFTYTASATDQGNIQFKAIILKKVEGGFRWGIFPEAVTVNSPGSSAAEGGANYGTVAGQDDYQCNCPAPQTVSMIRKCMPKTTATTKVVVTKTKTKTAVSTTTVKETQTTTVTETISTSCGIVAGGEETPTMKHKTSPMMHETPTMKHEPSPSSAYGGGYSSYSDDDEEEDDDY